MPEDAVHGLLVLDKPAGMTSRAAVNRAQAWFPGGTKIGHTGTLDPLATGVLVICLGHATRLAEYVQAMRKTYRSTFLLGARSDTDDADGHVTLVDVAQPPDEPTVRRTLATFVGETDQVPPAHSAVKVGGRRAYAVARRGDRVELAPRRVTICGIDLLSCQWPNLEVEVRCGVGTYVRSIARDLGEKLACGGLVSGLRRTSVGQFTADAAISLDASAAAARAHLRHIADAVAELPHLAMSDEDAKRFRHGQAIPHSGAGVHAVFDRNRDLIGIGNVDAAGQRLWPTKVIPVSE